MAIEHVQIMGLHRSGTTWAQQVFGQNFKCRIHGNARGPLCYKHQFPHEKAARGRGRQATTVWENLSAPGVATVVMRKYPDLWIASIRRRPAGIDKMYPDTNSDDGALAVHADYYAQWEVIEKSHTDRIMVVQYERMVAEPNTVMGEMVAQLGIPTAGQTEFSTHVGTYMAGVHVKAFPDVRREKYIAAWRVRGGSH